jgi:hypothetical protein
MLVVPARPAGAEPDSCKREIARADSRFSRAKMKALQKCYGDVVAGKAAGPCPDPSTASRIFNARAKLQSSIAKRCGGLDQTCSVTEDNDSLESINWDIGMCPNFENGSCTNSIVHCRHISDCLLCINDAAIDHLVALFYGGFTPTTNSLIRKCQVGLGKEASKFFQTKGKILGKCEDLVLKGSITPPCPNERADSRSRRPRARRSRRCAAAVAVPTMSAARMTTPASPASASSMSARPSIRRARRHRAVGRSRRSRT